MSIDIMRATYAIDFYNAYKKAVGGKSFEGKELPHFGY
jgi:hypothetical protein